MRSGPCDHTQVGGFGEHPQGFLEVPSRRPERLPLHLFVHQLLRAPKARGQVFLIGENQPRVQKHLEPVRSFFRFSQQRNGASVPEEICQTRAPGKGFNKAVSRLRLAEGSRGFVQRVQGWSLRLGEARAGTGVSTCDVDLRAERRIHSNGEERAATAAVGGLGPRVTVRGQRSGLRVRLIRAPASDASVCGPDARARQQRLSADGFFLAASGCSTKAPSTGSELEPSADHREPLIVI